MDQWLSGRSDDFLDHPGGRCRRTLKYFDEIGVLRDFLENQRDDRGRTIRVIRSQWDEKRGSMVVWSIGRFFGPSRRTVPEDFEIFRRDWSFTRFSRKPARRPRSNHQSNTFAMERETWINGCLVDRTIFGPSGGRCRRTLKFVGTLKYFDEIGVFTRFSRKPARRPRSNHQSNTFAMGRETWINGCLVDRTIFWTIPEDGAGGL